MSGLRIHSHFVSLNVDPFTLAGSYVTRNALISQTDGTVVWKMDDVIVPDSWSQRASDIAASKYFRKAGLGEDGKGHENSAKQLVARVANAITESGITQGGYFATDVDAETFRRELSAILITQTAAFNSPVWFNVGLSQSYGIKGRKGNWAWDSSDDTVKPCQDFYVRPQCSACFIQKVDDDLDGLYDLVHTEVSLFRGGSGTGSNFSPVRSKHEKLSGGGLSSGLLSFLEVFNRAAGSTKSGGTTRRAAKMVCLDMDHPEILDFIRWKLNEERKAQILIKFGGYPADFNGEAYNTVGGQNSNNSVRVTEAFMLAVQNNDPWQTTMRTTGAVVETLNAVDIWNEVAKAAWACADPGVQYDTTINKWHTTPNSGRINASNPCSEYMSLDNSACNLSSINLVKFLRKDGSFDLEGYAHTIEIMFLAMEILVDFSSYPTEKIARTTRDFRQLGIGYANLGTLLMLMGVPYDSEEGRAWASCLTAILNGRSYAMSASIAESKGAFAGYAANSMEMLNVLSMHRHAATLIDKTRVPDVIWGAAQDACVDACKLGELHGYRNAQATVLAPTGTIGLLMDCDTTGVEPDFALVKFKKLAGGGAMRIVNESVPEALHRLGYSEDEIRDIMIHVNGINTLIGAPTGHASLTVPSLTAEEFAAVEKALPGAFSLDQAFGPSVIGIPAYDRLHVDPKAGGRVLLGAMSLSGSDYDDIESLVLGHGTVEGAPHLKEKDLAVFDCANRCGKTGRRFIAAKAHLTMMAAVQPFLSGAISKTVNLPHEATVEEIRDLYEDGWKLGLKAVALYRDGSKGSQPLNTSGEDKRDEVKPAVRSLQAPPPVQRRKLPSRRKGYTQRVEISGYELYLRTGEYPDGKLGEIFIDIQKEGVILRALLNQFAIATSIALQHGVPLETLVSKFTFTRFDPSGPVQEDPDIKMCTSIIDYIFRHLAVNYLDRHDLSHTKASERKIDVQPILSEAAGESVGADSVGSLDSDAPACTECGHLTIRSGSCYKCINCGSTSGCS